MSTEGGSIWSRLAERIVGWIALGLLILVGVALWRMDPATRASLWSGAWRTVVWVLAAGLLPWSAKLFIRRLLDVGSNLAGVGLVGALVVIDALGGLVLMGGLPHGGWAWAASLAALAVAGSYNFLVAEYLAEQAGG